MTESENGNIGNNKETSTGITGQNGTLLASLLDTLDAGLVLLDPQKNICYWNLWMNNRSGLSTSDVMGKPFFEVFPDAQIGRLSQSIQDCMQFGMPAVISPSLNRGALSLGPLPQFAGRFSRMEQSIRVQAIKDEQNVVFCALTIRDVTLAVQRDRLLRKQAAELADLVNKTSRSEARTRAILQNTVDAILIASEDGEIAPLNVQALELCGENGDPYLSDIIRFLLPDIAGQSTPTLPSEDRLLTDPGTGVIEVLAQKKSGQQVPLEVAISQFFEDAHYHYIITLRDISQRKRHESEIRRTMSELERSNQELEQFAYAASHDLQEPMRMVSSYTQLLARRYKGKLDATADEFIHYAVDGTHRMQRMIDDLLALSRVSRQGKPFAPVDLELVFDAVETNFRRAETGSRVAIIRETKLPTIIGDSSQLLLLFQNLVSNGLKYSDPDEGQVRIAATESSTNWIITVTDNGIGIDPKYHATIFDVFKRLHGYGEYAGTGIGLAICKKIIERHHGSIDVKSAPGEGSSFCVKFPKEIRAETTEESKDQTDS